MSRVSPRPHRESESCEDSPVQVPVKFQDPAKPFQVRISFSWVGGWQWRLAVNHRVPYCVPRPHRESESCENNPGPIPVRPVPVKFPDPRRVRSHRSDSEILVPVPGSTTSPITSIRLTSPVPVKVPFLSSSNSRIQVRSRSSYTSPIPSIRLDSTFCLRFQLPAWTEINYFSWWFDSRIQESIGTTSATSSSTQKFGPALHRPSPTTYPENSTNPCAELVEAESLVICEEITWRPFFIGRS